jgi:phosphatidylinositol glycan class V
MDAPTWRLFLLSKLLFFMFALLSAVFLTPKWNDMEVMQTSVYPPTNAVDAALRSLLNNYSRWDGTHILGVSLMGYTFESQHVFFPLMPMLMRIGAGLLWPLPLSLLTRCQLVGILVSMAAHYCLIENIGQITSIAFPRQPRMLSLSVLFATLPPSTPFLNAIYAESLFAALSTFGMLAWLRRRHLMAAFSFFLAGFARSNGVFLAGFFLFEILRSRDIDAILCSAILFVATASPFLLFQIYSASLYCGKSAAGSPHVLDPVWCRARWPLYTPNLYSFVQDHYW